MTNRRGPGGGTRRPEDAPGYVRTTSSGAIVVSAEQGAKERELLALFEQMKADPQGEFERRIEPIMEMVEVYGEDDTDSLALAESIVLTIGGTLDELGIDRHRFAGELRRIARRLEEDDVAEDAADAALYWERSADE